MNNNQPVTDPQVSIIIPSWSGEITRLARSIETQTFKDYELIVVKDVSPAARARNQGVAQSQGEIIIFLDDDAYLGHDCVLERLITALDIDPMIGVVGSSKLLPPDASSIQKHIADEVPRWIYPIVTEDTETNPPLEQYGYTGITTTCCALRRSVFEQVGGFDEQLGTGPEDTEFFYRIRRLGYRFIIPHDCWVYHDAPKNIRALLRKSFKYGIGHTQEAYKAPERHMDIMPLDRWYGKLFALVLPLFFVPSLFVNLYFEPFRHIRFGFRPIKALSTYATFYGYCWGWFSMTRHQSSPSTAINRPSAGRSSLTVGIASILVAVLNYVFANVMAWLLPVPEYGMLGITQSWLLIAVTLVNSGFTWELARVLSSDSSLVQAYQAAKTAVAGVLIIAAGFVAFLVGTMFFTGFGFGTNNQLIIGLIGAETFLFALTAVCTSILQGTLRFSVIGAGQVTEAFMKVVLAVALVLLGFGVTGAIMAIVASSAMYFVMIVWKTRHFTFWREHSWSSWQRIRNSLTMFIALFSLAVVTNIDIIGLQFFSPVQQVATAAGYYQAAEMLTRVAILLMAAYASALFPYFARVRSQEIGGYIVLALKYALFAIVPLNLILVAIPEAVITFIFPQSYLIVAPALRIAAIAAILLALANILVVALHAHELAHITARWIFLAVVVQIGALWLLVPQYGLVGAAASFLLSSALTCGGLVIESIKIHHWRIPMSSALYYIAIGVLFTVLLRMLPHYNRVWTVASCLLAFMVYGALLSIARLLRATDVQVLTDGLPLKQNAYVDAVRRYCATTIDWLNHIGLRRSADTL